MWQRLKITVKKMSTLEYSPRYSRLAGDLSCYRPLLEKRIADGGNPGAQWAVQAKKLLEDAEDFMKGNKIDEAWKSFHAAKRMEVYAMNTEELLANAKTLFYEAGKQNEWRKEAIINLLSTQKTGVTAAPSAEILNMAMEIKDEAYNNQFYLSRLSRNLFWLLSGLLFLVISGIVIYFAVTINKLGSNFATGLNLTGYLVGVLLFGLLGALTSAIVSTRTLSQSSRISELGSSEVITMSKIFIGAGFSIFIFLLLRSSVADKINLFSFSISQPLDYFAIAFASGFTERFARRSIELLIGKDKATVNEKKKSAPVVEG
ncbi:MAG: hypothetical protein WCR72_05920 [Bacteroidota bacterium]